MKSLKVLLEEGLVKGKTIGIDATTLEANAALIDPGLTEPPPEPTTLS